MSLATDGSSGVTAGDIVTGALEAVRSSPVILVVFAVWGVLTSFVPTSGPVLGLLVSLATTAVSAAGVLIAYQALGGRPETDVSFGLRVVGAFVTSLVVGVVVLVGLVALVIPGIYIGVRLLLAVPAVVVDGHGPIRALSVSWRAMGGSVLATFGASVAVFVTVFVAIVVLVVLSPFFASVAAVALAGSLFSGLQAFVYLRSRGEYDPLR